MFSKLRAELKALGDIMDQHMKGDGFPFERGVKASLDAMHGTVQELDSRVHALEVQSGIKEHTDKPANVLAELAEAEARKPAEAQPAAGTQEEGKPAGEAGSPAGAASA